MGGRPSWIIWYSVALHVIWGVILIVSRDRLITTPTHIIPGPYQFLSGIMLLTVGLSAGVGQLSGHRHYGLLALFPQQFIMLLSAGSALRNVIVGSYSDGYIPAHSPHLFILTDQLPTILASLFHTIAVLELGKFNWSSLWFK